MATEKPTPKLTLQMFKVAYGYMSETNQLRTGAVIIPAEDPIKARSAATTRLAQDFDWFKINSIRAIGNDHPQQTL